MNSKGYKEFQDPKTGAWTPIYRRAAENKFGTVPAGRHVHHINGDKSDNRYRNLAHVSPAVHGLLHANEKEAGERCFRCGRCGHWATQCRYKTDFRGSPIG